MIEILSVTTNENCASSSRCRDQEQERDPQREAVSRFRSMASEDACRFFISVGKEQLVFGFYLRLQIAFAAVLNRNDHSFFTGIVGDSLLLVVDFRNRIAIRSGFVEFQSFEQDRTILIVGRFGYFLAVFILQPESELTVFQALACQSF